MSKIPLGPAELGFIAIYLLSLIGIGYCGMRARTENSLKDFYLAGSGVGFLVLVLTLYATQYSGNTLFAFTGKTYRIGYAWLMSVHFMTAIIVVYLVFAPGLHRLAKRESFITPADFLEHRFSHRPYTVLASITMVVAIGNYLLAQLTAMGLLLQSMTTFEPQTAFVAGVILLAVIMLVYETLGGFRAVAWTDVIQGGILMVGFASGDWGRPNVPHLVTRNYSLLGVMPSGYDRAFKQKAQDTMMEHYEAGRLRVPLHREIAFDDLPAGIEELARGGVLGKSVLIAPSTS